MSNHQVLIIIGLPGCGKTTYSQHLNDYIIFDDFINKFYDGFAIKAIQLGKSICLIDPRLCINNIFCKYIREIEKYIERENIKLVLFENNPDQCLRNIKSRKC